MALLDYMFGATESDSLLDNLLRPRQTATENNARRMNQAYGLLQTQLQGQEQEARGQYNQQAENAAIASARDAEMANVEGPLLPTDRGGVAQDFTPDKQWGGFSPIEQWQNQVNAMIYSGVPEMRAQGLGMLQPYHQRATEHNKPIAAAKPVFQQVGVLDAQGNTIPGMTIQKRVMPDGSLVDVPGAVPKRSRANVADPLSESLSPSDMAKVVNMEGGTPYKGVTLTHRDMLSGKYRYKPASTEAERKGAKYYAMMANSEKNIGNLRSKGGFDEAAFMNSLSNTGSFLESLTKNVIRTPAQQQYSASRGQWSASAVYSLTGAAATTDEVQNVDRVFWPQPGDDVSTIQLKRQMRADYMDAVYSGSTKEQEKYKVLVEEEKKKEKAPTSTPDIANKSNITRATVGQDAVPTGTNTIFAPGKGPKSYGLPKGVVLID